MSEAAKRCSASRPLTIPNVERFQEAKMIDITLLLFVLFMNCAAFGALGGAIFVAITVTPLVWLMVPPAALVAALWVSAWPSIKV
jgi:hypothetical protein